MKKGIDSSKFTSEKELEKEYKELLTYYNNISPTQSEPDMPMQEVIEKESEMNQLKLREYEDTIKMRTDWSRFLMWMIFLMITFQIVLFLLVGSEKLIYKDEWLARIVLSGTFAQVVGMVYVILNYLFPNNKK